MFLFAGWDCRSNFGNWNELFRLGSSARRALGLGLGFGDCRLDVRGWDNGVSGAEGPPCTQSRLVIGSAFRNDPLLAFWGDTSLAF